MLSVAAVRDRPITTIEGVGDTPAGAKVQKAVIYKDQRFSDHAPLIMDYEL